MLLLMMMMMVVGAGTMGGGMRGGRGPDKVVFECAFGGG